MMLPFPGWFRGHVHSLKRNAATIKEENCAALCSVLQCARASAEKYNGKRFVKEFNTVLMKS
jgi:hypothetical protein